MAAYYDLLNHSVGYDRWVDYLICHFARADRKIESVVDLACGTGTMTKLMAERGYDMLGVDMSPDMLSVAQQKTAGLKNAPVFIRQNIVELDLFGTADAMICCLDSINYILNPDDLRKCLQKVALFLNPGGMLIFDVNTEAKFLKISDHCFIDEGDGVYCSWRAFYKKKTKQAIFQMDLFTKQRELWQRQQEDHYERAYSQTELSSMLEDAGFIKIKKYANLKMHAPREDEERIFFTAIRRE